MFNFMPYCWTKAEDVHLVLHNYVIRNSVSVPPASHEVAINAYMLAGGRVPELATEIHNLKNG